MNRSESVQIITNLRGVFGSYPQPDWSDPITMTGWYQALDPYGVGDALTAVNEYRERCEAKLNAGEKIFFPAPVDFGAVVRIVALKHERQDYERHALDAAIRCDGTRWIDNEPNTSGVRPFMALGVGVVPCPTCSPAQHAKSLGGDIHSRMETKGEQVSPPPCRPHHSIDELPVSAERAPEYIAECKAIVAAWNPQSPLKAALEKGWS